MLHKFERRLFYIGGLFFTIILLFKSVHFVYIHPAAYTRIGRSSVNLQQRSFVPHSKAENKNRWPIIEFDKTFRNASVVCDAFIRGNNDTSLAVNTSTDLTSDKTVLSYAEDCQILYKKYEFIEVGQLSVSTTNETDFPIAYAIQIHSNIHQFTTLLSAIYRKHNVYCIHLDGKVQGVTRRALEAVTKCFPNVFVSSRNEKVVYASVRRLLADIICMKDLLAIPYNMYNWKYLINLCGQDFPLRTNYEIVQQLLLLKDRNNIGGEAVAPNKEHKLRTEVKYRIEESKSGGNIVEKLVRTNEKHTLPPYNMTVRKNLAYNVYTRQFLQWALIDSKIGKELLEWSRDTYSPDEHYWLMLNSHPEAPGGSAHISWWGVTPHILWRRSGTENLCKGYWRNGICVFGGQDLPKLVNSNKLFVNKVDMQRDSTVTTCLRQMLDARLYDRTNLKSPIIPQTTFFI